jgi:hypothetical protein
MRWADEMNPIDGLSTRRGDARAALVKLAIVILLIAIASRAGDDVLGALRAALSADAAIQGTLAAAILAYVILMALPFCPGIEIGLALIVLGGREIVPLVYVATVVALVLAFMIGRFVPPRSVIEMLGLLGLARARDLLLQIDPLDAEQRLRFLLGRGRPRPLRWLLEHRYVAVALALNTPGNLIVGDGGGIALAAGFSRLFSLRGFALTVALAVLPIPLAVLLLPL